jgi:phosphoglycolate phosphatase
MSMQHSYAAAIFDLDGTLADTINDIAGCANECAALMGRAPVPVAEYRYLVGDGAARLAARVLETDDEIQVASFVQTFRERLVEWQVRTTALYPGMRELLALLEKRRIPCAVVSNKPQDATAALIRHLLPDYPFVAVFGQRPDVPRKPDPAGALEAAKLMNVPAGRTLYLGDTGTDMETGRHAGMATVGVLWGFRPARELVEAGAQALVAQPADVADLLRGLPPVTYLATDRLIVRPTIAADLPVIEPFWQDPQANRLDHGTSDPGAWQEENVERLGQLLEKRPSRTMWTIALVPSLAVIGYIRLRGHSVLRSRATVGVRLGRAWWGQGYAAEGLKTLREHLVRERKIRFFDLEVLAQNTRALRAYEKAGFSLARRLRRNGRLWLSLEWHAPA